MFKNSIDFPRKGKEFPSALGFCPGMCRRSRCRNFLALPPQTKNFPPLPHEVGVRYMRQHSTAAYMHCINRGGRGDRKFNDVLPHHIKIVHQTFDKCHLWIPAGRSFAACFFVDENADMSKNSTVFHFDVEVTTRAHFLQKHAPLSVADRKKKF